MANWSLPTLSDLYTNFRAYLTARLDDVAKMFDSALVSATNLPTGTKRWNSTASKWEKWDGSAWSPMATTYGISISGNAATASQASGLTPGVALGNIGANGIGYAYIRQLDNGFRALGINGPGPGNVGEVSISSMLDWVTLSAGLGAPDQGSILYKANGGWWRLPPGTSGDFLMTRGAGADPVWSAAVPVDAGVAKVGALCFAAPVSGTSGSIPTGTEVSGDVLRPAGIRFNLSTGEVTVAIKNNFDVLDGTWKCLGMSYYDGTLSQATLWQKVS